VIFVTVGTTAFESLIKTVDLISNKIEENIICQIADGNYIPKNCEYFRFKATVENEIRSADLVICHGGAGTLFNLLELNKKIIAVPNLERKDKHQTDLIDTLSEGNHIISCYDLSELLTKILNSKEIDLTEYKHPECRIAEEIIKFIG
jgi:beta-1,4-N-acetylglucosaminyltransferase